MAKYRIDQHPVAASWSAGGAINLELSPKPYTITEMILTVVIDALDTTATPGTLNDWADRVIASLALTDAGKTHFSFTDMRAARHFTRFFDPSPRLPASIAASQTAASVTFAYKLHFGVNPSNPFDLTAGIPPTGAGNLSLTGAWGAAAAPGAGWTINSAKLYVSLFGVQPDAGDPVTAYLPQAFPVWTMRSPSISATSGLFSTQDNIPAGDYLHDILVMSMLGTGAPRSDAMLGSILLYNQLESRELMRFDTYKLAEIITQSNYRLDAPVDEEAAAAATTVPSAVVSDVGLVWLPVGQISKGGHPLYGANLRGVNTGDLQLRFGVASVTNGATMDLVYRKYQLNPAHPANAGA